MTWLSYTAQFSTEPDEILFEDLSSLQPVVGVAKSQGGLRTVQSTALVFTGFAITGTVTGLDLELSVRRLGRIQDKVVQLWINGSAYGDNLADLSAENTAVYAWRNLNLQWQQDYGVIIDLQPHTQYPSSNLVVIQSLRLRTVS